MIGSSSGDPATYRNASKRTQPGQKWDAFNATGATASNGFAVEFRERCAHGLRVIARYMALGRSRHDPTAVTATPIDEDEVARGIAALRRVASTRSSGETLGEIWKRSLEARAD